MTTAKGNNRRDGVRSIDCSEFIFEIVDTSDEETYFTIGVFLSLENAVAAIEANDEPWTLCESAMYAGDYASAFGLPINGGLP